MKRRRLGNSELEIAPLAFGGNVFGWTADERTSFEMLDAFAAAGFNLVDTADVYSVWANGNQGGESETIIGRWLKRRGRRKDLIVATKVGMEMQGRKGLSKSRIMQAAEDSLRRLQTDYIDLYQSHRDDPDTPVEETLEAYAELIRHGKVRVIGASNYSAARLDESLLASATACPGTRAFSPSTTSTTASRSRRSLSRSARRRTSASSATIRWRAASSPASTVLKTI